jgi:3-phytase
MFLSACRHEEKLNIVKIKEVYQTPRNEPDNVDSPTIWHGPNSEHWIIATAKSTDRLIINDALNGEELFRVSESGDSLGQLERPNGIAVIDSFVVVVERDNHRLQVFGLPEFNPIGFFAQADLIKPYGLYIQKQKDNYRIFVTDNYETVDEQVPPNEELNERVVVFDVEMTDSLLNAKLVKKFGATEGDGVLKVVESIYGDTLYNNLLIAEELQPGTNVKLYDFDGNYKNKIIGKDLFKFQVEGISLFECGSGGYWIITDQDYDYNIFHFLDRKTFEYVGSIEGFNTTNTDGIWFDPTPFGEFEKGIFLAIHNDGNVSAFDFKEIADTLNLKTNCK